MTIDLGVLGTKVKKEPIKEFKKLTCMLKEEEFLAPQKGIVNAGEKRFRYTLMTLQNDMGFGAKTGDMVETVVIYSMDQNRFATGNKYEIEFKAL